MKAKLCPIILIFCCAFVQSQNYWQQAADYKMTVDMDVESFQYAGNQELLYTNNSPDSLNKVFYHLYFNAFQPGSQMAIRVKMAKTKTGDSKWISTN